MNRLTRALVLLSAGAALVTISYLTPFFRIDAAFWVLVVLTVRTFPRIALGLALLLAYITPAILVLAIGRNETAFTTFWLGGLLALIAGGSWAQGWSFPTRWRWPLVVVSLTFALCWPLIAWRELDYTVQNIWRDRLPVVGVKLSGLAVSGGIAFTTAINLVGLLWFDWLCGTFSQRRRDFLRFVVAPLGIGMVIACLVAVYQGVVDVSFLSGHVWPSIRRTTGTLMDANVFAMLAALWGPAFLVLAVNQRKLSTAVALVAALLLSWLGVWFSGSRTAALTSVVGTGITLVVLRKPLLQYRHARIGTVVAAVAALILILTLAALPSRTATAVERARYLVPSMSFASVTNTVRELWERDGYGTTATAMIREFPLVGIGVGCYNILVHDFGTERGLNIPPDNAQNWLRQQIAELGLIGSAGWIVWTVLFCVALWSPTTPGCGPGVALRGPLTGFGLASLVGMPGQDPAVVVTFWLFAFWCAMDAGFIVGQPPRISPKAWTVILVMPVTYAVAVAMPGDLRPPFRAARFNFPYTYGMDFESPTQVWTGKHGVTVQQASDEWMKLTVWVNHPEADQNPVDVDVWKDHDHVINEGVFLRERVTRYVQVGKGNRFVLEAEVDRTFRPSDVVTSPDQRDLGLAMKWEFLPGPPK